MTSRFDADRFHLKKFNIGGIVIDPKPGIRFENLIKTLSMAILLVQVFSDAFLRKKYSYVVRNGGKHIRRSFFCGMRSRVR
jgi:hypothetical protein